MTRRMSCRRSVAFTLVELMVVIAIVAVLSVIAIYGVRRYLAASKTAEAINALGGIGRGCVAAYHAHAGVSKALVMPPVTDDSGSWNGPWWGSFFPPPFGPIPVPPIVPQGTKYQPRSTPGVDFQQEGWQRIRFSISEPIYYQYMITIDGNPVGPPLGGPDPGPDGIEVSARGDLDGDGVQSTFTLPIVWDDAIGEPRMATQIFKHMPHE